MSKKIENSIDYWHQKYLDKVDELEKLGELTQSVTKISEQEQKLNECKDAVEASVEYRKFREECGIKDTVMLDEIEEAYYNGATSIQKPAWNDEDEDNLRYSELHFKTFLSNTYYDTFCNWLKSLKERLSKR